MQQKTINVNGRRVNKLEEIVQLLAKLNETSYSKEILDTCGCPIQIHLEADGSGVIWQKGGGTVYNFSDVVDLETFLKAEKGMQFRMIQESEKV